MAHMPSSHATNAADRSAMNAENVIKPGSGGIAYSTYHEVIVWELRAAIERYFEYLWELYWKQQQGNELYLVPIEQRRLPIVVLSSTLLECAINFYLCIKCNAKQFKKIQRERLFDKWTETPKQFVPGYNIQDASGLKNDLKKLIDRRNVIIHSKPLIVVDGGNAHQGNEPDIKLDEHEFMGRCVGLPYKLVENLGGCDAESRMFLTGLHMNCGSVDNVFERENRKLKWKISIPRELILEIMGQGHDLKTAIICAAMIESETDRRTNESGNIELWPRWGQKVEIKPLEFFTKQQTKTS